MKAAATRIVRSEAVAAARKELPFRIVPAPAPKRGFFAVVALCGFLVFGSLMASFIVNNAMVRTAFEISALQTKTNEARAIEATLEDEILRLSSPEGLTKRAEELGLAPATSIRHIDLEKGTILETVNLQGE